MPASALLILSGQTLKMTQCIGCVEMIVLQAVVHIQTEIPLRNLFLKQFLYQFNF